MRRRLSAENKHCDKVSQDKKMLKRQKAESQSTEGHKVLNDKVLKIQIAESKSRHKNTKFLGEATHWPVANC